MRKLVRRTATGSDRHVVPGVGVVPDDPLRGLLGHEESEILSPASPGAEREGGASRFLPLTSKES